MQIQSKLPSLETTIFAVMSAMANKYNAINLSQGYPNFKSDEKLMDLVHDLGNCHPYHHKDILVFYLKTF